MKRYILIALIYAIYYLLLIYKFINRRLKMKKEIITTFSLIFAMFCVLAVAPAEEDGQIPVLKPSRITVPGGAYEIAPLNSQGMPQEDMMIFYPSKPLTTDRYAVVGQIKTLGGMPDVKEADKLTPEGADLRNMLMQVKSPNGFFAFYTVVVRHTTASLIKHNVVKWDDIESECVKIFSSLEN
jgi:hypothetical protein